ncbi:MAG: FkbM family methyltransferase [Chitinophagaceae bacterium]
MTKLFKPLISWWRLYKKTKNFRFAYKMLPNVFTPPLNTTPQIKNGKITFVNTQTTFTKRQVSLFGEHGELLLKFIKSKNIFFTQPGNDAEIIAVRLNGKDLRLHANSYDNLKVIEEIFIDQLYDFQSKGEFVVCDVGMNVAAATLYFASFDNVEQIYGYEPFPQTFALAEKNIRLNEEVKNKIHVFNFGLGEKDLTLEVPHPEDGFLGGTTTGFMISELPGNLKTKKIKVEIKDIRTELTQIKKNHPGKKIILKLDCEGAEYEIIEALRQISMIADIDIYMIEYHFKGKKSIADVLVENNFIVMSPGSEDVNPFGMLYAIKK